MGSGCKDELEGSSADDLNYPAAADEVPTSRSCIIPTNFDTTGNLYSQYDGSLYGKPSVNDITLALATDLEMPTAGSP